MEELLGVVDRVELNPAALHLCPTACSTFPAAVGGALEPAEEDDAIASTIPVLGDVEGETINWLGVSAEETARFMAKAGTFGGRSDITSERLYVGLGANRPACHWKLEYPAISPGFGLFPVEDSVFWCYPDGENISSNAPAELPSSTILSRSPVRVSC